MSTVWLIFGVLLCFCSGVRDKIDADFIAAMLLAAHAFARSIMLDAKG